jgi:hypothetical protein
MVELSVNAILRGSYQISRRAYGSNGARCSNGSWKLHLQGSLLVVFHLLNDFPIFLDDFEASFGFSVSGLRRAGPIGGAKLGREPRGPGEFLLDIASGGTAKRILERQPA